MGILESNKRSGKSNKGVVVTSRLTSEEYEKFKEICDASGYSISEAVRLLIITEINPKQRQAKPYAPEPYVPKPYVPPVAATMPTASTVDSPVEGAENPVRSMPRPVQRIAHAKFVTERWKVDDSLPCPICQKWYSATNFSRHAKSHSMTTEEIFTSFENEADEMVRGAEQEV